MQGILKSNHQKLCDCLQDVKEMEPVADSKLNELEEEIKTVFLHYQEKMKELKLLIQLYEEKQKLIRSKIKKIRKDNIGASKSQDHLVLDKVVALIILLLNNILILP